MKRLFSALLGGAALAASQCKPAVTEQLPPGVQQTIAAYVRAGDQQDSAGFEAITSPEFRVIAPDYPKPGAVAIIDRGSFAALLAARKLGGSPRSLQFLSVDPSGDTALTVAIEMKSAALHFDCRLTLVRSPGGDDWKIIQDLAHATPL